MPAAAAPPVSVKEEYVSTDLETCLYGDFPDCLAEAKKFLRRMEATRDRGNTGYWVDRAPRYALLSRWYKETCWEVREILSAWWPVWGQVFYGSYDHARLYNLNDFLVGLLQFEIEKGDLTDRHTTTRIRRLMSASPNRLAILETLCENECLFSTISNHYALREAFVDVAGAALLERPEAMTRGWLSFFVQTLVQNPSPSTIGTWCDFTCYSDKGWGESNSNLTVLAFAYGLGMHLCDLMRTITLSDPYLIKTFVCLIGNVVEDVQRHWLSLPPHFRPMAYEWAKRHGVDRKDFYFFENGQWKI